ncbi:Tautomerase-3 domain-containing protein [Mycena chlorophos]|uniref:Tautomerase-3 domain-containing protein n=1 Tax=Mycena chlorophos TaxID=658473 RepID=A0A8H6W4A4_MYCCL|nr:Tautomerase-3 domain-containing protein [Mycena chlorophos]
MPLHRFYVPKGLYSGADKSAIAQAITDLYGAAMPRFYVAVFFVEFGEEDFYFSGEKASKRKFVRIDIDHLARTFTDDAAKEKFMARYEKVLEPFTKARGIEWEIQIKDQCDWALWHEDGMRPPPPNSVEEWIWRKENRAVPPAEVKALKAKL